MAIRKNPLSLELRGGPRGFSTFRTVVRWRAGAVVVAVSGEIDMTTADELHSAIAGVLHESPDVVIVDLSGVTFLGSAGLYILTRHRHALAAGTRFVVVSATYVTTRPIELIGLQDSVEVFGSLGEAIDSLRR